MIELHDAADGEYSMLDPNLYDPINENGLHFSIFDDSRLIARTGFWEDNLIATTYLLWPGKEEPIAVTRLVKQMHERIAPTMDKVICYVNNRDNSACRFAELIGYQYERETPDGMYSMMRYVG